MVYVSNKPCQVKNEGDMCCSECEKISDVTAIASKALSFSPLPEQVDYFELRALGDASKLALLMKHIRQADYMKVGRIRTGVPI